MNDPTDSDWNWFAKFPHRETGKKLPRSAEDELIRMCVWEYARECRPLVEAISKYRDTVRIGQRAREEADELVQVIERMAGRFNWRFLCSPDFPDKAWLDLSSRRSNAYADFPFAERASIRPTDVTIEVKHGKRTRPQKVDWLPTPPRFFGDLEIPKFWGRSIDSSSR